jgi:ribonuclease Z
MQTGDHRTSTVVAPTAAGEPPVVREMVVLGTASSVPTRHRNHNGYLLNWDTEAILFDPGEGTQRQLLRSSRRASRITRICLTHFHGDHCLGLPGILQRLSVDHARQVDVHYPAAGQPHFEAALVASAWDREELVIRPHPETGGAITAGPLTITAMPLDHSVPTLGYRVDEAPVRHMLPNRLDTLGITGEDVGRLEADGFYDLDDGRRVQVEEASTVAPGNSLAFVMDTRLCDAAFELAAGVDLLVCESTFLDTESDLAAAYGHLTAAQAARIAAEAGARQLLLTHFSQRHPDESAFVEEARRFFPNVIAAHDLLVVPLPQRRRLPT